MNRKKKPLGLRKKHLERIWSNHKSHKIDVYVKTQHLINNTISKWEKDMNRLFTEVDMQVPNKHIKDIQYHYPLGKYKLKTQ